MDKNLDILDRHILTLLQEDARRSYREIGRIVGLSSPAVAERVRQMEEAGVITGYHAATSYEKLGFAVQAFMRISATGTRGPELIQQVRQLPEIVECYRITGSDNYLCKIVVANIADLESLIDRLAVYGQPTTSLVLSTPLKRHILEKKAES